MNQELEETYVNLPNEHCTILQDQVFTTWSCTKEMRWLETDDSTLVLNSGGKAVAIYLATKQVLQQKWLSNTGEEKWVDVPTVKEER